MEVTIKTIQNGFLIITVDVNGEQKAIYTPTIDEETTITLSRILNGSLEVNMKEEDMSEDL